MVKTRISKADFLADVQGKTFTDVVNDPKQPFDCVLDFFDDADRQRRMEESELHHDRAPLAGVVRELESQPAIDRFLGTAQTRRNTRFRQAIGVLVRIIMERRGWKKTGRKGSLGVRAPKASQTSAHNSGGLAFWFVRAERYELPSGMPYQSVRQRCENSVAPATESKARIRGSRLDHQSDPFRRCQRQSRSRQRNRRRHPGIGCRHSRCFIHRLDVTDTLSMNASAFVALPNRPGLPC